jgi:predicted amidohydrolase
MQKLIFKFLILFSSVTLAGGQVDPIDEVFAPEPPSPIEDFVKIAVVATSPSGTAPLTDSKEVAERFKSQNRLDLERFIREAAQNGAEIVLTPEFGIVGYPDQPHLPDHEDNFKSPEEVEPYSETSRGPSFTFFSALARELGIFIHYGFVTTGDQPREFFNTVQVVDPSGELVAEYNKIALFELENDYLKPGVEGAIYESPAGRVGIIICADVYTESALRWYRGEVELLALSTSWARPNSGMSAFRSTAAELRVHLAAANQTYYPDSGVINPDGSTQSHIRQSEGIAYGYLPRKN